MIDRDESIDSVFKVLPFIFVCLVIGVIIWGTFYIISAGERGVLLTFGKPDMVAKTEGLHLKIPLVQHIVKMDVKTQKYTVPKATAASKDLQDVYTDITLNYYIVPENTPEIYTKIGIGFEDKIIAPAVLEVVKASTAQYTAEELVTKRPEVKERIDKTLTERLREFNVIVQAVSITDFKFSEVFTQSIETKVAAVQGALTAKNKLEQIKFEAEQKVASAQAEATALSLQKQFITPELLMLRQIEVQSKSLDVQLKAIDKWSGQLPQVTGNNIPFLSMQLNPNFGNYTK